MIAVIDYGMGNLRSVVKALEQAGGQAELVTAPADLERAEKIVLPGVSAFADAIEHLRTAGFVKPVLTAIEQGRPYLGICLGLQMLLDVSYEDGEHRGMGVIPGTVERFSFEAAAEKLAVPHMGWNQLEIRRDGNPLLHGIEGGAYVYFCHSYHAVPLAADVTATTTRYGYDFVSSIWKDNVFGVQFHPEKSQAVGLKLLENFVRL